MVIDKSNIALPPITDEDEQHLHYNPNTSDLVDFVKDYARRAVELNLSVLTEDQEMELTAADILSPAYWRGHDMAVAGVAGRWEEALTDPMPKPGVMHEPLETLYRRTEALRFGASAYQYLRDQGIWNHGAPYAHLLPYVVVPRLEGTWLLDGEKLDRKMKELIK